MIAFYKFLTLRVTPPAYPVPALAPKCSKIAPTWQQNGANNFQNRAQMGPRGAQMEPKWRQDGVKTAKKSTKKRQSNKKEGGPHSVAPLEPKKWPTWPQLGAQNKAKMAKKSIPQSIIFLMLLGIDFGMDFGGFLIPKRSQVGTKMGSKIDIKFEGLKPTKH